MQGGAEHLSDLEGKAETEVKPRAAAEAAEATSPPVRARFPFLELSHWAGPEIS